MFKGFAAAQAKYEDLLPEDFDAPDVKSRLDDLGYNSEVIEGVGITVLRKGKFKFFGTEDEIMEWLTENGEA